LHSGDACTVAEESFPDGEKGCAGSGNQHTYIIEPLYSLDPPKPELSSE
jgi:hypothetical protein